MKLCASWSIWSLGIQPEQLLLSRDSRRTNQQTRKHRNQLNFRLEHKQNFVQLKFLESCDKMIMINYSNPWLSTMGIKTVSIALFKNLIVQIIAVHNWKFSESFFLEFIEHWKQSCPLVAVRKIKQWKQSGPYCIQ